MPALASPSCPLPTGNSTPIAVSTHGARLLAPKPCAHQNQGSLEKWPSSGLGREGLGRAWSVLCRELQKGSKKDEDMFVCWKDMSLPSGVGGGRDRLSPRVAQKVWLPPTHTRRQRADDRAP